MGFEFIGFVLFFAAIFLARSMNDKANRSLDQDKKALLIDLFSKNTKHYIILFLLVLLTIITYTTKIFDPFLVSLGFFSFLITIFALSIQRIAKKLRQNNFPNRYIQIVNKASFLRLVGISAMLFCLACNLQP